MAARNIRMACGRKCIVSGCSRSYRTHENISLFRFPRNSYYNNIWMRNCRLTSNTDTSKLSICDDHFEKQYLGKKKLKKEAVPTKRLFNVKSKLIKIDDEPNAERDPYNFIDVNEKIPPEFKKLKENKVTANLAAFEVDDNHRGSIPDQSLSVESLLAFKEPGRAKLWADIDEATNQLSDDNDDANEFCSNCLKREKNEAFYRKIYYEVLQKFQKQSENILKYRKTIAALRGRANKQARKKREVQEKLKMIKKSSVEWNAKKPKNVSKNITGERNVKLKNTCP